MKKILKLYGHCIDSISDERQNGDGIWVTLNENYIDKEFDPKYPTRQIHEQTISAIIERLKNIARCRRA
jgi:hypothetical protein